jgi:hypothetical protein
MRLRNKILWGALIFSLTYSAALFVWIQVKPVYGTVLAQMGVRLAGWTAGLEVESIDHGREVAIVTFSRPLITGRGIADFLVELRISVSNYSFNVPLTFALVAALLPFFKWRKKSLLEAGLILGFIHLLYIYSYCNLELFYNLSKSGIKTPSRPVQYLLQFMWAFVDNMIIRFEPFLVAVYLWLRNRAPGEQVSVSQA